MSRAGRILVLAALAAGTLAAAPIRAQQILIDKPIRAADLIVFPSADDANAYYYVVDRPSLASGDNGKPQFSFLRYVENVRSRGSESELDEGEGGGIVHAVVSLSVSDDQRREAQRELQRVHPGARLEGPVVFRSGTFGLVSSFTDPEGNLSRQVVGLGNAPLLDGEKAAVSMQLTRLGSKILWESFQTAVPDVSFSFEMQIAGLRSPKRAVIEADFDQIYEHQGFSAGVAMPYLAADIKTAFDDLRREGAIRITQIGEDEQLEALVTTAYNKIAAMMFAPLGGTGTPGPGDLIAAANSGESMLDRASERLEASRAEAREVNDAIRERNADRARQSQANPDMLAGNAKGLREAAVELERAAAEPGLDPDVAQSLRDYAAAYKKSAGEYEAEEAEVRQRDEGMTGPPEEEVPVPAFSVVASYEMKRVRQSGRFRIDLNKFTDDTLTLRFDENIGDLRRYLDDSSYFRQVNLDDPLYRQREIVAFVDGLNASDFGEYVNFVTVELRKRHQGGEETHDEVRIDRKNFNRESNSFKLLYGWKGDNDRRRWMNYDYRTVWSFFGGAEVAGDWRSATAGAIDLAPPYQRRRVDLEAADAAALEEAGVRAITVRLYYRLGEREQVRQVVLNASRGELSKSVEFMLPADQLAYEYEIDWRLRGNRSLSSGRVSATDAILFVDELPDA